ncbi:PIN domain-containing protein [Chrysosporum bergii ANA360D]|jgi:PIN domain nuclease of toxin-antitoxin system|uniref:PIN domain-containing protein n=1 Tax=Chrysosporum bergii ANA360D TaxID=617107 RepID=A0AA43GV67_9CYAN|nr:PIN domain-containing protein [Chrysosporum bergii]MDH6061951.1 PIN domain-containing protein [Chrysosporum bergii ANA360D]
MKYVIDTHGLIWFLEGNSRLSTTAKAILSQADAQLIIPTTTLAEAVWVVEQGKTSIPDPKDIISVVQADPRVVIYPFDQEVLAMTLKLSAINEMHNRQIAATAIILASKGEDVRLLTCDKNLTDSGLVAVVW